MTQTAGSSSDAEHAADARRPLSLGLPRLAQREEPRLLAARVGDRADATSPRARSGRQADRRGDDFQTRPRSSRRLGEGSKNAVPSRCRFHPEWETRSTRRGVYLGEKVDRRPRGAARPSGVNPVAARVAAPFALFVIPVTPDARFQAVSACLLGLIGPAWTRTIQSSPRIRPGSNGSSASWSACLQDCGDGWHELRSALRIDRPS